MIFCLLMIYIMLEIEYNSLQAFFVSELDCEFFQCPTTTTITTLLSLQCYFNSFNWFFSYPLCPRLIIIFLCCCWWWWCCECYVWLHTYLLYRVILVVFTPLTALPFAPFSLSRSVCFVAMSMLCVTYCVGAATFPP